MTKEFLDFRISHIYVHLAEAKSGSQSDSGTRGQVLALYCVYKQDTSAKGWQVHYFLEVFQHSMILKKSVSERFLQTVV